jgi:tetratricopeptide (TPR) repeat protein
MDRRHGLLVALGLLCGSVGCAHHTGLQVAAKDEPAPTEVSKEPDLPKRQPLASTCVAFAKFNERSAADPRRSRAEQEHFRDQARKAYQQALRIDPNDLTASTALARLYITMGDYEHAVGTYQQALQKHPKEAPVWHELGMCYAQQKQWEPAIENLRHAVELDPEQRLYNHSLGFCLTRSGRYDEGFAVFAKLEGEASAHYDVARMLHHVNEDQLCKQHLRQALRLKPEMVPARELLAKLESPKPTSAATGSPVSMDSLD